MIPSEAELKAEVDRQAQELATLSKRDGEKYTMYVDGCALWQGSLEKGIPVWYYKGRRYHVRQLVYAYKLEPLFGKMPKGYYLDVTCGNKDCIHSSHLVLKNRLDNIRGT